MRFLKNRSTRFYLVFFFIVAMTVGGATFGVFADSGGATVSVKAGTLTETGTFGQSVSATLDGTDQVVTYSLPVAVKDVTGSGAGWNLQISGTPLSDGVTGHPALAQQISAASSSCGSGQCTNAANSVSLPVAIGSTASKYFNAAANSGMGNMTVTATAQVAVPANTYVGTYSTTLNLSITAGP